MDITLQWFVLMRLFYAEQNRRIESLRWTSISRLRRRHRIASNTSGKVTTNMRLMKHKNG